jgi:hypothetical protein
MSVTINHDESFNIVTQTALQQAFMAILEAPAVPGESGAARSQRLFESCRQSLSAAPAGSSDARTARIIGNDLSDLFPEYWFSEPGQYPSFIQYFDSQGGMVYEIRNEPE